MFYQLKNDTEKEQFNRYWKEEKASDSPLWNKVKPSKGGYVVRSHGERKKTSSASLPFKLVRASKSMDVWSFGLIMFELLSGETFAHVNREDDLIDIQSAASWTTLAIEAQLNNLLNDKISMQAALSLLKKLLVVDPRKRLTMKEVLNDPFFRPVGTSEIVAELHNHSTQLSDVLHISNDTNRGINEINLQLNHLSALVHTILTEVHKSRDVLLKGLFEKTDVPTSFLILPHKLNELNANTNSHDYLDIMSKKDLFTN
jgi:serine/threonine protein kinase